jgi:hypothetical protein
MNNLVSIDFESTSWSEVVGRTMVDWIEEFAKLNILRDFCWYFRNWSGKLNLQKVLRITGSIMSSLSTMSMTIKFVMSKNSSHSSRTVTFRGIIPIFIQVLYSLLWRRFTV